jgi:hypothetical protein
VKLPEGLVDIYTNPTGPEDEGERGDESEEDAV